MYLFDVNAVLLQLMLGMLLGLFADVGVVESSLEATENTVGLLARLVGGVVASRRASKVDGAGFGLLEDAARMFLGLFRSVGVLKVGLVATDDVAWV